MKTLTSIISTLPFPVKNRGFTLIEIIILIVMAAILLPVIVVPFATGIKGSQKPEMATTAIYLAHQKMEELMKFHYTNAALNPASLPPSFSDIDPINFPSYQWRWEILYVNSDFQVVGDGIQPGNDRGYKRIRVQVRDPQNDIYEIYSVVTRFP
ncbi:MAG: type II secretion system GspH family protein [Desulfobacterota bacterium]|nr:type II secretion system GspH family protein [Thermodesulfobacteriota bacterium]